MALHRLLKLFSDSISIRDLILLYRISIISLKIEDNTVEGYGKRLRYKTCKISLIGSNNRFNPFIEDIFTVGSNYCGTNANIIIEEDSLMKRVIIIQCQPNPSIEYCVWKIDDRLYSGYCRTSNLPDTMLYCVKMNNDVINVVLRHDATYGIIYNLQSVVLNESESEDAMKAAEIVLNLIQ